MLALEMTARCCRRVREPVQLRLRTSPKRDVLPRPPDLSLDAKVYTDECGIYRWPGLCMFWSGLQICGGRTGWGDIEGNSSVGRKMES